jgi:CrcB protein
MVLYLLIALGGALGSVARFWLSGVVANQIGATFPWGTFAVNVTGSFIIGFFATLTGPDGRIFAGSSTRQFFMTGVCGGYTTFSSFSLQTLNLANDGEWFQAGGNAALSLAGCLIAVWFGYLAAATVLRDAMGFGKSSRLHTAKILRLSMDLPLVIEIVDSGEKINAFLPVLDQMIGSGLVTLEKARVLHYRGNVNAPTRYPTPPNP